MDLQLASLWLEREQVGLADIQQFSMQCRDAAANVTRESAALALLAAQSTMFVDRHQAAPVSAEALARFLCELQSEIRVLQRASTTSDTAFDQALNATASKMHQDTTELA